MNIYGKIVQTPYDETYPDYDPNWRSLVAQYWAESEGNWTPPPFINDDEYIRKHLEYLRYELSHRTDNPPLEFWRVSPALQPFKMAHTWHERVERNDFIRFKLEPLLLTGASIDTVAHDIGGQYTPPEVLNIYEKLYFNIRDTDGKLTESCHICMRFAFDGNAELNDRVPTSTIWKVCAYQLGYTGIHTMWHTRKPYGTYEDDTLFTSELLRMIKSTMITRLVRGDVNTFDLNSMLGQYVNYENMIINRGVAGVDKEDSSRVLVSKILRAMAPKIIDTALTVDQQAEKTEKIRSKVMASRAVLLQQGYDAGVDVGNAAVNKALNRRVAEAAGSVQ